MVDAIITFSLPEDETTDLLYIYSSSTEEGTYSQVGSPLDYEYGMTTVETEVDETEWYKIQFSSSSSGYASPMSDPIFGGDFADRSSPFLALSTTFDGANYASVSEVYERSGLTETECSVNMVQKILRSTRAYIDVRLGELNLGTYRFAYNKGVSRRKYNGHLRVTRDIEINLAISTVMSKLATEAELDLARRFADDTVPEYEETVERTEGDGVRSVAIGPQTTTYNDDSTVTKTVENEQIRTQRTLARISIFNEQAERYRNQAANLWNSIMPTTIEVSYGQFGKKRPSLAISPLSYDWVINGHTYNSMTI